MNEWINRCHFGDVRDVLRQMAAAGVKVNCIVTSPPYWGLRSYLPEGHPDKPREIGSEPTLGEFIATFPEALVERCLIPGCPPGGTVLDIFLGSGTTAQLAQRLGMNWIGIDLDLRNDALQRERIGGQAAFPLEQAA